MHAFMLNKNAIIRPLQRGRQEAWPLLRSMLERFFDKAEDEHACHSYSKADQIKIACKQLAYTLFFYNLLIAGSWLLLHLLKYKVY